MSEVMRLAFRGFAQGVRQFEEFVDVDSDSMDSRLQELAEKHATRMMPLAPYMMEIEFLDEPDPGERFLRFGTDRGMMVSPQELEL